MPSDKKIKTVYSDDSDDSDDTPESASDTDSDTAIKIVKRPKLKAKRRKTLVNDKTNKYKIWCTQVQEESLTENLVSCGVTRKIDQGRNVENYDLPKKYHSNGHNRSNNSTDEDINNEIRITNKRTNKDRKNIKLRLGKRNNSMDIDTQKGSGRTIPNLTTTIESSDVDVANDIADKLKEQKDSLIRKFYYIFLFKKCIY